MDESAPSDVDPLTLDRQVCFALAVATRGVIAVYRPLLEPLGLTHPQYLVMVAMWQQEPSSVSPVLKRLQSAGLIERHRDADDERTVRLTLTADGRALKQRASGIPAAMADRLDLSPDEVASLHQNLLGLIERAQRAPR